MPDVTCARCGKDGPRMAKAPLRNELGQRVFENVCQDCWDQWLKFQTALINHHGLDVRDQPARDFLMAQMEGFFFATRSTEEIDTTKQGTISW